MNTAAPLPSSAMSVAVPTRCATDVEGLAYESMMEYRWCVAEELRGHFGESVLQAPRMLSAHVPTCVA